MRDQGFPGGKQRNGHCTFCREYLKGLWTYSEYIIIEKWWFDLRLFVRSMFRYATPGSISKEYSAFADYYCKNFAGN